MSLSVDQRVNIARELLDGLANDEYEQLPTECMVSIQEAIDFLDRYERAKEETEGPL